LVPLLKELAVSFTADFGLIEPARKAPGPSVGATTWDLVKAIPEFYWATVFGRPYVELFGRSRLARVKAAVNVELAPGLFYIQLTERLADVAEQPQRVDELRTAAVEVLGSDAFADPAAQTPRRLPKFVLQASSDPFYVRQKANLAQALAQRQTKATTANGH
jgi:hypothetical protein